MTITAVPKFVLGPHPHISTAVPTTSATPLDNVGEFAGNVMRAAVTGTIDAIVGFIVGIGGTGTADLDFRLETVSASTGLATGTLLGTNSNGTQTVLSTDDNKWWEVPLTTPKAVTKGDIFAALIKISSMTGVTNVQPGNEARSDSTYTYAVADSGTGQAMLTVTTNMLIGVRYSTGDIYYYTMPSTAYKSIASAAVNTGAPVRRYGAYFTPDVSVRVTGLELVHTLAGTSSDFDVKLYAANGTTLLASGSYDASQSEGARAQKQQVHFTTDYTCVAGTAYHIVVEPTTANSVTFYGRQAEGNDQLGLLPGGKNFYLATYDGSSWSYDNTIQPMFSLICNGIDAGGSAGMLYTPGMDGGMQ